MGTLEGSPVSTLPLAADQSETVMLFANQLTSQLTLLWRSHAPSSALPSESVDAPMLLLSMLEWDLEGPDSPSLLPPLSNLLVPLRMPVVV